MSFYEKLNPLTTVAKQRFVETFSASTLNGVAWVTSTSYSIGDTVSESGKGYVCLTAHTSGTFATDLSAGKWRESGRWSFNQVRGTNSYAMSDSADGGLVLTTGSSSWDGGSITFGDKRQYSPTGSVIIQVTKLTDPTTCGIEAGFSDHQDGANIASAADGASMENSFQNSYIRLGTAQTGSYTWATSTIARTSDWITSKVELKTASCELSINGVYATTVTETLPTGKSQPIFIPFTNSGVKTASIRYCEAYNT